MASVTDIASAEAAAPPNGPPQPPEPPARRPGAAAERASKGEARGAATIEVRADAGRPPRLRWPRMSPLTRRIVAVNVLPLALLAVGFLYLGKFEATLIGQHIESLRTQGRIFAAALSEGAVLDWPTRAKSCCPIWRAK